MTADVLLNRLEGVRQTGPRRWMAICPSHDDRRPSLSVRELEDGRVLAHCFANCPIENVLSALELTFDALYPARTIEDAPAISRPWRLRDVAQALEFELTLALTTLSEAVEGLAELDRKRALEARARILRFIEELQRAG